MKTLFHYTYKIILLILMIFFLRNIYKSYIENKNKKGECFNKFIIYKQKYLSKEFRKNNGLPILELNEDVEFNNFELQLYKNSKNNYTSVNSFNYYCFNNSEQIKYIINKDSIITIQTFYNGNKIENFFTLKIKKHIIFINNEDMKVAYSILKKHNLIDNSSKYFYGLNKDSLK